MNTELLLPLAGALSLGLVTGLHCVGMCGPLALALPVVGSSRTAYVSGRLLYNLGRALTYAGMGAVLGLMLQAGSLRSSFNVGSFQRGVSLVMGLLLLTGLLLMASGVLNRILERLGVFAVFAKLQGVWARNFKHRTFSGLLTLGLINGLLPCGPVYVALAAAVALGSPATSALFMFVFGLGTLPMMLGVSLAGKLVQLPLRRRLQKLAPVCAGVVAVLLITRGLALGIPYLSPPVEATELGGNPHACCGSEP
ncbi:MAG TPA: sulfite exporter TauE/SafE family protein [Kiritimatiellia bacterium]|nr:sulfite exporter TauE/SafE family protein [Kiritimatiellia bacterium]HMO99969.1 sulfite exporter TauE/SafE family protein [Kiritimatiellia bacterium]